jgi:hypothetical protein
MNPSLRIACCLGASLLLASCRSVEPGAPDAASAKEIESDVRQMAASIARDVGRDGPIAWLRYFVKGPEFFMASDGKLQFSNFNEAKAFMGGYAAGVAHLELTWGEMRIDPVSPGAAVVASPYSEVLTDLKGRTLRYDGYFTGLAVETNSGWRLRDAHWSSPVASR